MIGLILDVDGFIVDTRNHFMGVYNRVFEKFGVPKMTREELFPRLAPDYTLILKNLGIDSEESRSYQVSVWNKALEINEFGVSLYKGALEFLEELKNYRVVFATASGRNHIEFYKKLGLDGDYTFVTRDEVANPKPHQDHYNAALAKLGTKPENTIVIDDIRHNLETARHMKMIPKGVTWGFSNREQFKEIGVEYADSFDELLLGIQRLDGKVI